MALTNTQTVALQLEKVRKKLPILYERGDVLFNIIEKRDVEKVSTRTARIPLQVQPGGAFGYASLDGGDLGRGSGTVYDVAQITPVGLRFAVEINKLVEYATNASEKAVADVAKKQVADAMKQFRRDLDAQLQTAGNAVMGTVSSIASSPTFTLSSTPFGARLIRENQVLQVYDSTITTNRGTVTCTARQQGLGLTQTVTLSAGTCPLANIQNTDVLLPDGLSGASPVGLFGIPYHHNTSAAGTWMGISRANVYTQADLVNANSNGFALPFVRLAKHKIMQNIGIEEAEALKSLRWYGHPAQQAAYHEIAFSIAMLNKTGGDQSFDMMFSSESIAGIKPIWNPHADETRLDLLNLETWGRVEWKEIDYLEIGGQTVFPVYGASGGIAAAYLFYLITGVNMGATCAKSQDIKFSLIKLNPAMGTDCKQANGRAAVTTERENTLPGDATVCSASNTEDAEVGRNDQPRVSGNNAPIFRGQSQGSGRHYFTRCADQLLVIA